MVMKVKFRITEPGSSKEENKVAVLTTSSTDDKHCYSNAIRILEDDWGYYLKEVYSVETVSDLDYLLLREEFDITEVNIE